MNMHVVPRDDLIEHDTDEECVCRPTPRFEDGGIVYVHHSLDGRELAEDWGTTEASGDPTTAHTHRARWSWRRVICAIKGCRFAGWSDAGAQPGKPLPAAYCARCNQEF